MIKQDEIVNRVANSPIISLDLELFVDRTPRVIYDLKQNLFQELILKEKDFRQFLKEHDFSQYRGKYVGITCSANAIIPNWAYMLLVVNIKPFAKDVFLANKEELEIEILRNSFDEKLNPSDFKDKKVVVKGCSEITNSEFAFAEVTKRLCNEVESLMFGEPCSTVPVFKRRKF